MESQARLLLQRSTPDEPIDGLDHLMETVKHPSSPWSGALYGFADDELPAALWSLLCQYMPRLEYVVVLKRLTLQSRSDGCSARRDRRGHLQRQ